MSPYLSITHNSKGSLGQPLWSLRARISPALTVKLPILVIKIHKVAKTPTLTEQPELMIDITIKTVIDKFLAVELMTSLQIGAGWYIDYNSGRSAH